MPQITEADRYLLQQIRRGDHGGWAQLVERYQGRLLAFARGRLGRKSEAEDLVQETFLAFLEAIERFNEKHSLETFLFTILRRRLIDLLRGRQLRVCLMGDVMARGGSDNADDPSSRFASPDMTASFYVARQEQSQLLRGALSAAIEALVGRLKEAENLRDLQIVEMLFYAQIRNKDAAKFVGMDEKAVALIKHRCLNEIRQHVADHAALGAADQSFVRSQAWETSDAIGSMISEIWENDRPTCPKRSTVGRLLLGSLQDPWKRFVQFHVETLKCQFCAANLEDLKKQTDYEPAQLRDRVMHSTIGFFRQ